MKTPVLESLLKRDSNIGFKKFLKTPIFKNICERLLLEKIGNILYQNENKNTQARNGVILYSNVNIMFCFVFCFI